MSTYDCWEIADAVLGVSRRTLLYGPPGTGKTYAAVRRGLVEGTTVYSITMTEETPMAEIRGHFVQTDGSFVWMDGPAIRAWKEGARLVINEIDRAGDDVLSFLYAIMDDPGFAELTLPTGETLSPTEGFQLVATMNGVPDDLPDALQDRLPVTINISDLNPDALARLPEDLQDAARNTSLLENGARRLSIRAWLEFATLREHFIPQKGREEGMLLAAQAVFGKRGDEAILALNIADEASEDFTIETAPKTKDEAFFTVIKVIEEAGKRAGLSRYEIGVNSTSWIDIKEAEINRAYTLWGYNLEINLSWAAGDGDPRTAFQNAHSEGSFPWFFADGTLVNP